MRFLIPIANVADLEEALSQVNAIVFFSVQWSVQSRRSEEIAKRLVEEVNSNRSGPMIPGYRLDLSDQKGDIWDAVLTWLNHEKQPVSEMMFGGTGSLVLIRSGHIVGSEIYVAGRNYLELLEFVGTALSKTSTN